LKTKFYATEAGEQLDEQAMFNWPVSPRRRRCTAWTLSVNRRLVLVVVLVLVIDWVA